MPAPAMTYALFAPLVLFVIYRRVRRNFGRQPLRSGRLAVRVVIFAVVAALLLMSSVLGIHLGMAGAAGLLGGAALGIYGLHLTRIEDTPAGRFYIPSGYIGMGLTALLLARLAYRFAVVMPMVGGGTTVAQDPAAMSALHRSPLTLAIAGLLVGYYLAYYGGLLWRVHATAVRATR